MNKKKLLNLSAIILGVMTLFSFNKVQASEITSVFSDEEITRSNLASVAQTMSLSNMSSETLELQISKNRESGNYYQWNITTTDEGKTVWKIAEVDSSNLRNYSNLYYCLNATVGFGITEGNMAEGASDEYSDRFDMKDSTDKTSITNYASGNLGTNYNKILWILDHSYIPGHSSQEDRNKLLESASEYLLQANNNRFIQDSKINYINKNMVDNNIKDANLTDEDIEIVQQMAIWYYTNSNDETYHLTSGELPTMYINGENIRGKGTYYNITGEDYNINMVYAGNVRELKMNTLFKYFISEAEKNYNSSNNIDSTLTLSKTEANVTESGNYYVAGPFTLSKSDISVTGLTVKLNNTELSSSDYLLVSSVSSTTNITDYDNLNKFYLKINKDKITTNSTIDIEVGGKYSERELTFITDASNPNDTQPVVLVEQTEKTKNTSTDIDIELTEVTVEKIWDDNNNQDGLRPNNVEVQLYKDGKEYGDSVTLSKSNNWTYTWNKLLREYTYTVEEVKVPDGYSVSYSDDTFTITNTYTPLNPDLALRKYITSINGTEIKSDNDNYRVPEIDTANLDNGDDTTARYVHKKNPIEVKTGDVVVYNITIYNEGEKDTRASKITDQLPTGLKYEEIITAGYTAEYNEDTNRLVITKTGTDNLSAYTGNGTLDSETIQVKCIVAAQSSESNQILTNIAWISEMKDASNNTFESDIDSDVKDIDSQYNKDNMSTYEGKENDNGYYKGQQDDDDFDRLILLSEGTLNIKLQKTDEEGNVITSSEATFEITEGSNDKQTLTTENGVLDLGSKKLNSSDFSYEYIIKETKAPTGYSIIPEELTVKISGTTKLENNAYTVDESKITITDKDENALDSKKISAEYDSDLNTVIIKVKDIKIANSYSIKLLKVGEDGTTAVKGAWFKINGGQAILISEDGNEIATGTLTEEGNLNLTYKLEETTAPDGYIKIDGQKEVKITAKVELKDDKYEITEVKLQEEIDGITISEENNVITIKVKNEPEITGKYSVVLRKVDENGNVLKGSKFNVNGTEYELSTGEITIVKDADLTSAEDINLTYELKETKAPDGYEEISDKSIKIKAKIQRVNNDYKLVRAELVNSEGNTITDEDISVKIESDTIVIVVKNTPIQKQFDLALRKFITNVNETTYSREPVVDTSTIAETGTATYKHIKGPIAVQKGDIVTYTIRVYNEGEVDGYVDKITDHLPDNLIPIIEGIDGIDSEKYAEEIDFNLNWGWVFTDKGNTITTMKTAKVNSDTYSLLEGYENVTDTKLDAYVEGSDKLDYIDVQIKCLVTDNVVSGEYLTNIAEITESQDINGVQGDGNDSKLANADISNLADYKNEEAINSTENSYVEGQEDDDDFEKLVVKEFDLALRKFITKVNETTHSREPVVDTSKLGTTVDGKTITTATYNHTKEPVIVETEDLVTYTIRIYNEGTLDGFANEITDDIPEGLEFLPDSSINVSYRWKMIDSEGNETEDVSKAVIIVTDYLSDANENNIIKAVSETEGVKTLSYKDVQVQFKVVAKAEKLQDNIIINEAQISADSDRDIDSVPNRDEKYDYDIGKNEDDIDYEPIKLQYFDLALRKFITKVNTTDYNNRYPEIIYNEDGSITYNHTKDPVLVATGDTIIYTIRVYNEGEKAGYATEVTDNLPEGLEFLPEDETNKLYSWKMLDEEGNVTDDVAKAKKITTDVLKDELIDALVVENNQKVLSYKDIQVAFKVKAESKVNELIINTAEISKDSDDDIDSTPGNDIDTEDDLDKEYIKVEYFDLSLKKWVTATKVTYNGKTTVTKTGFTEDTDKIAKVDIVASRLKKTTVKFVYSIKVTNEGEIPGYAYEVKDYIPKGLKFVEADNKDWKEVKDGEVVTDKLKDTLLNPGESATVEIVLTWKNSSTNMGLKTNYAEISEDSGDDIDSTPNNYELDEDDIDDAQVILSIKTAGVKTYIGLILISVSILAVGVFLIKKYVIK